MVCVCVFGVCGCACACLVCVVCECAFGVMFEGEGVLGSVSVLVCVFESKEVHGKTVGLSALEKAQAESVVVGAVDEETGTEVCL